ncbi:MAG: hypothetical protein RL477_2229 [Pseudomonadota bacterium]
MPGFLRMLSWSFAVFLASGMASPPVPAETFRTKQGIVFDVPPGWRVDAAYDRGGAAKLVHAQTGHMLFISRGDPAGKKGAYTRKESLSGGRVLEWAFAEMAQFGGFDYYLGRVSLGKSPLLMSTSTATLKGGMPESIALTAMRHVAETACRATAC